MRTYLGVAAAVLFTACLGSAQIPTSGNVFFGYSYSRENAFPGNPPTVNLNGWEGSLEGKFLPWIGLVADFGAGYGSKTILIPAPIGGAAQTKVRKYTYLVGPRVSIPVGRFTPFAHALFGAGHVNDGGVTDT